MSANLLYWSIKAATRNFDVSRVSLLPLDGNQKEYEVQEHIATKLEVNIRNFQH